MSREDQVKELEEAKDLLAKAIRKAAEKTSKYADSGDLGQASGCATVAINLITAYEAINPPYLPG